MFDIDLIEQDYLINSFKLSEEEIIHIFQLEGVTISEYAKQLDEYRKKTHRPSYLTAEERLLEGIFEYDKVKKEDEEFQESIKNIPEPKRPRLSKEAQKKIVEGCLYLIFDVTRDYYKFFQGNISMEIIYYICLETLMNCVKYALHNEKPVFKYYVLKSIEKSIIKYIARKEHIDYKDAYEIIHYGNSDYSTIKDDFHKIKLSFNYNNDEELVKPSEIFYILRNKFFDVDYLSNILSKKFWNNYKNALDNLSYDERTVMQLSYDRNGYKGLTYKEISEYLGIDISKVSNIKKRAIRKLKKDNNFIEYL